MHTPPGPHGFPAHSSMSTQEPSGALYEPEASQVTAPASVQLIPGGTGQDTPLSCRFGTGASPRLKAVGCEHTVYPHSRWLYTRHQSPKTRIARACKPHRQIGAGGVGVAVIQCQGTFIDLYPKHHIVAVASAIGDLKNWMHQP